MKFIVTGGSGFIGNHLILKLLKDKHQVLNIDKLTYAADHNFYPDDSNYSFQRIDICDTYDINDIFNSFVPDGVFNLAAVSHVDRSIVYSDECLRTNVFGLQNLLQCSLKYLENGAPNHFRFLQVSTDEVYGSLGPNDPPFTEKSNYKPNTPYSATKAAGDMLIRCFVNTYKLPALTTHCTNNFGTRQHPEKFIPKCIFNFLNNKPITIYGSGEHIRDWIHVDDHCNGIVKAFFDGMIGENYLFGSEHGTSNNDIAKLIWSIINNRYKELKDMSKFIVHTPDKNHDFRYAVDCTYTKSCLNWDAKLPLNTALAEIVDWYYNNMAWLQKMHRQN